MKNKGKRWDKVDHAILTTHAKYHTAREIADKLGRPVGGVQSKARDLGITLKRGYNLTIPKPNAWSEAELEYLHKNAGTKTSIEMSKELNRSVYAIKIMATRQGLSLQKNPWSDEEIDRLIELHGLGLSDKAIAKKIGRASESVRAKITYLMLPKNYIWSDEEIDTLFRLKAEGKSSTQIAKVISRTPQSVRKKYARLKNAR
jgi:hypothetical protein